ncbi:serine/threonine-protein kinase [Ideonella sp.]|uniref:serine/threonine-protein kinase n=1 Tax=Ideonella sp. TaxID=1929293 RepID=UPI002B4A6640|nr:serine/threonine-protein kinase [Ideonella sp.]HJV72280.1 serine/threonine-protein kinase [Ideonella sp.]
MDRISPDNWPALSALLDEALELPAGERAAWLDALPPDAQPLRPTLELMLARADTGSGPIAPDFPQAVAAAAEGWQPGARVGPYALRRQIGRGGMGSVWEAERDDGVLQRTVALKLPHAWLDGPGLAERLARERNILARLAHPNIARLYDAGVSAGGHPYMAMELVEGEPITRHCDARRLPPRERVALFLQVLDAVQYAHARLVVHRDIKPSNILVTPAGQAMLLDFGIAKLLDDGSAAETELTRQAGRMLTPEYASPEQLTGQVLTTASDVYSLGRVLYELLVGQRPFDLPHASAAALEQAIVTGDVIPPSLARVDEDAAGCRGLSPKRLAAELTGDLDTIVGHALKADPAQRYQSAAALRDDLARYLHGEPVLARPDSAWYRARKFAARHRLALGSAAVAFTALAVGLGAAVWQASVARQEATRSALEARKASSIKNFLVEVFDASDPNGTVDKQPSQYTAAEILDTGARHIETAFADEPAVRLELLLTLAGLYDEIGLPDRAAHLCELAVKTAGDDPAFKSAGRVPPSPTLGLADAWRCLGMALEGNDKNAAMRSLERAETVMRALGDRQSLVFAQVETLKAGMLREHGPGQLEAARDLLRGVMPAWQLYPQHQGHVYAWLFLADIQWQLGDRGAAVEAADRGVAAAAAMAKPVVLSDAHRERASYAMRQGDLARAATEYAGAADAVLARLGPRHWRTLSARCDLGPALALRGQRQQAIDLLTAATAEMEQVFPGSDQLSICYERLASAYGTLGRPDLAGPPLTKAAAILRRLDSRKQWAKDMLGVAQAQDFLGHTAQARQTLREAVSTFGDPGPTLARLREAEIDLRDQRPEAAARALDALVSEASGPPPELMQARALRAEAALRSGDTAGAIELAGQALLALSAQNLQWLPGIQPQLQLTQGEARCASSGPGGAPDGAGVPLLRAAVQTLQTQQDPDSPPLAAARARLGACLLRLGQRDEAASLARQAEAALRAHRALNGFYWQPVRDLQRGLGPRGAHESTKGRS